MYNKKSGIIGIVITAVLLILLVFFSNIKSGSLSYIENVFTSIIMPIQNGYTYLKNKVSGNVNFFNNMDTLKQENERLQNENIKLAQDLRELEIMKAENETLKEYLGLTQKYSNYTAIPAYIISKDISNYSKIFVINIGSRDGISENMTVISDQGLVGHIISVTESTAKVQTIIDTSSAVTANLSHSEDSIICKGSLNDGKLKATYIPTNADIAEGDNIETSGMGGIFPKGIIIGKVESIENTKNPLDKYAWIEPTVDFEKVETVLIITN